MKLWKIALFVALTVGLAHPAVNYILRNTNDMVYPASIKWPGVNNGDILIGTNGSMMVVTNADVLIKAALEGDYVTRPAPDWCGPAVSNLDMGTKSIGNVGAITAKTVFVGTQGGSLRVSGDGVISAGFVDGIRSNKSDSVTMLGFVDSTSRQRDFDSRGSLLGGFLANGSVQDIWGGSYRASICFGSLNSATQEILNSGSGMNLGWLGPGQFQLIDGCNGSINFGVNNSNTHNRAVTFGANTVTHYDDEVSGRKFYIYDDPINQRHAVPLVMLTNRVAELSNNFVDVILPGLAASDDETRQGALSYKYVNPSSLKSMLNGIGDGLYRAPGGYIDMSGGTNGNTVLLHNMGGTGGYINISGGESPRAIGAGIGGNGGVLDLSGADTSYPTTPYDGGHGGSLILKGSPKERHGGSIVSTGGVYYSGGPVNGVGGSLDMSSGGGSINTYAGTVQLGVPGVRTTLLKTSTEDRSITFPNASGKVALQEWVTENELQAASAYETRDGQLSSKYVSPYALRDVIRSSHGGSTAGYVNVSGGLNMSGIRNAGTGGVINMSGGNSFEELAGGDSGSIDLHGGNGGGFSARGGNGGSITLSGTAGISGGGKNGGHIVSMGGSSGNGGSLDMSNGGGYINTLNNGGYINTANGGGSIDTYAGTIALGTTPGRITISKPSGTLASGVVYLPYVNSMNVTMMTTVAKTSLNMAGQWQIVNVPWATDPTNAPPLGQVMGMTNAIMLEVRPSLVSPATLPQIRLGGNALGYINPVVLTNVLNVKNGAFPGNDPARVYADGLGGCVLINGGDAGTNFALANGYSAYGGQAGSIFAEGGNGGRFLARNTSAPALFSHPRSSSGGYGGSLYLRGGAGGRSDGNVNGRCGGDGGAGGRIDLSGGAGSHSTNFVNIYGSPVVNWGLNGHPGGTGGIIELRGGPALTFDSQIPNNDTDGSGGSAGSIILSGGQGRNIGGDLRAGYVGGSLVSTGGFNGAGGSLLMSDGGGSIDTVNGTLELGLSLARTTIRKGTSGSYDLFLPTKPMVDYADNTPEWTINSVTVMTTIATVDLNMTNRNIIGVGNLPTAGSPNVNTYAVNYCQITNMMYEMSLLTTPIGTIQAWPTDTPPDGWMLCNGASLDNQSSSPQGYPYRPLYNVVQHTFGGSGVYFNVPDYRGWFLRGKDARLQTDPSHVDTQAPRLVGSIQEDSFEAHNHSVSVRHSTINGDLGFENGFIIPSSDGGAYSGLRFYQTYNIETYYTLVHSVTENTLGDGETKPKNSAVNYIIRYH